MVSEVGADSSDSVIADPASLKIVARMERLPLSRWHLKARLIVGSATFFDAIDYLAIGMALPVVARLWHLTPEEVGLLISGGFLGQMLGAIGFGRLAERIGRIPTAMITTAVFGIGGIGSALTWGFLSMFTLRFLQGLGLGAEVPVAATYINEIAPAGRRGRFVLLYEFVFVVGILAAGFLGRWTVPNWGWQSIFWIGSAPPLLVILAMRNLPESPRWLAGKGRLADAEAALSKIERQIANRGHVLPPPAKLTRPAMTSEGNWRELFNETYFVRTVVIWTIWGTLGLVVWPLTIWLPTIYRNIYHVSLEQALNYSLYTNIIQVTAAICCALLIDHIGRRRWFVGGLAVAGLSLLLLGFSGAHTAFGVFAFTSFALFAIGSINLAVYVYTPELYSTRVRALGCGVAVSCNKIGSMLSPTIIGWAMSHHRLNLIFVGFGLIPILASIVAALYAVETKRRVLEEVSP